MGIIKKVLGKVIFPEPVGFSPKNDQFHMPFKVELGPEDIHIHWQDIRIEMEADDFETFAVSIRDAYKNWVDGGRKKVSKEVIVLSRWPSHHRRVFPRTEMEKLYYDNAFQIELQEKGHIHIHYNNFRWELSVKQFYKVLLVMLKAFIKLNDLERA